VAAHSGAGRGTACEDSLCLPVTGLNGMVLKEGNGHERNLFYGTYAVNIDPQVLDEGFIYRIVFGLKSKDL
jgi:hypothetical protein